MHITLLKINIGCCNYLLSIDIDKTVITVIIYILYKWCYVRYQVYYQNNRSIFCETVLSYHMQFAIRDHVQKEKFVYVNHLILPRRLSILSINSSRNNLRSWMLTHHTISWGDLNASFKLPSPILYHWLS